jgi:hypothetical protein
MRLAAQRSAQVAAEVISLDQASPSGGEVDKALPGPPLPCRLAQLRPLPALTHRRILELMAIDPALLVRTAAKWNIEPDIAREVMSRDLNCVYCKRDFAEDLSGPRARLPTWEHIINDLTLVGAANIALCFWGCNASKGTKTLASWRESEYWRLRGITSDSMAPVAANALLG